MIYVRTWDDVVHHVAAARDKGRMVSNFFPDERRVTRWCENGTFAHVECDDTTFFLRRQETFSNLYFLSTGTEALAKDVVALMGANKLGRLVVDVLGRDDMREPLETAFKDNGFNVLTTLQRMSRRTPTEKHVCESGVDVAETADAKAIHDLLTANFIAEEEQLPSLEEVHDWISTQTLLVAREGKSQDICGFVIFDLSPASLYLRYWFVAPNVRGRGIGGKLMRSMFAASANTKRQYFWVKADNENAIKRYQHYGFAFEPLKDVVLAL